MGTMSSHGGKVIVELGIDRVTDGTVGSVGPWGSSFELEIDTVNQSDTFVNYHAYLTQEQ